MAVLPSEGGGDGSGEGEEKDGGGGDLGAALCGAIRRACAVLRE